MNQAKSTLKLCNLCKNFLIDENNNSLCKKYQVIYLIDGTTQYLKAEIARYNEQLCSVKGMKFEKRTDYTLIED